MMVTVLGSGTLLPDDGHRSAAHLVQGDGFLLLLDCGSGTVHGFHRSAVDWRSLSHLALSHFHTDHVGDLPGLFWALRHGAPDRTRPLTVLGPPGTARLLAGLADVFGDFVADPGFPVRVAELERSGVWVDPEGRFTLRTHPTVHTEESVAFRLEAPAGTVAYTGDAGPDDALFSFLAGADVLISECCLPDPPAMDTHLSPAGVARMGRIALPGVLVTTHVYPPLEREEIPALVRARGYDGRVVAGTDGLSFTVPDAS